MIEINIHELKVLPDWYSLSRNLAKNFEIRKNDRYFEVGDYIILTREPGNIGPVVFERLVRQITYVLRDCEFPEGIAKGYCILGLGPVEAESALVIIALKETQKQLEEARDHRYY